MPLISTFIDIIDGVQLDKKWSKLRDLLLQKGYSEEFVKLAIAATAYTMADDFERKKIHKKQGVSKEEFEARIIYPTYTRMLQHEDVAYLLIDNKKNAKEAHNAAVEIIKQNKA